MKMKAGMIHHLLKYQTKGKTDSVPLVLTFPDVLPNVNEILNKTTSNFRKFKLFKDFFY